MKDFISKLQVLFNQLLLLHRHMLTTTVDLRLVLIIVNADHIVAI